LTLPRSASTPRPARRARPGASGQRAYLALREAILEGRYQPGERLKEVEVASTLGISRTPVRQAFVQLELEAMVSLEPHRGAIVRELTEADLHEMFVLRAVLEGFCASEAATRMDVSAIEHLEALHEEFERVIARRASPARTDRLVALNSEFHEAVVAGSGLTRVTAVIDKLTAIPDAWKTGFWDSRRQREAAVVYHREVIEAIRARDPLRADAVMKSHVYAAKDYFTSELRRHEEGDA
jgi:DNA-binding GntR family transcriptional regulator